MSEHRRIPGTGQCAFVVGTQTFATDDGLLGIRDVYRVIDCTEDHEREVGEEASVERKPPVDLTDLRGELWGDTVLCDAFGDFVPDHVVDRILTIVGDMAQSAEIERLTRELRTAERAIDGYTEEVAALNYKCLSEEDLRLRLTRELAEARELIAAAKNLNFRLTWAITEVLDGSTQHELHTQGVAMDERLGDYLTRKEGGE